MNAVYEHLNEIGGSFKAFAKWVVLSCIVGGVVGLVGTFFHYCIFYGTKFRMEHFWMIWLLPIGGLLIVFSYRVCKMADDKGTNMILVSVRSKEQLSIKMAPLIFISTCITHLCGGSAGREGAALQLGGSLGYQIGKWFHLDEKDLHMITMCGMSAAFSALFGTPLTATVFSMEVVSVGAMYYAALVPCALASLIGFSISNYFGAIPTAFRLSAIPKIDAITMLQVILLGVFCAGLSIIFCNGLHWSGKLYKKYISNQYIRIAVGGCLVIGLTYLFNTTDYLGAGMDIIQKSMSEKLQPEAFFLKMLFTAVTLGAGFKGGEIVPAFFVGAAFGNVAGGLLGLNPCFAAAIGLITVFCGVTNCPLTAFLLSMELFGVQGAIYYLIAISVSYMLSGYYGLYSKQKILYSKFKPEFIDRFID